MPIYEYECKKCGVIEERLVSTKDQDNIRCAKRHKMIKLFPTGTNFKLKGNWFKTTKSY
jgi:putative FmdB family regulatory protein